MKKILFMISAFLLFFCSCQPKIHYEDGTKFCYIDTKEGRLWGIGWLNECKVYPAFERIEKFDNAEGYICYLQGSYYLYDSNEQPMCGGEALVSAPKLQKAYQGMGIYEYYYQAYSASGLYAIYASDSWGGSCTYGPFEDFVPGHCGYMFKDSATGKWGVGKYGEWSIRSKNGMTPADKYNFAPSDSVLVEPKFEKIVNVAYFREAHTSVWVGFSKKTDIKWYGFDGKKWHGFDIEGKPIAVKNSELNQALKTKVRVEKIPSLFGFKTQRLGKDDASVYVIGS